MKIKLLTVGSRLFATAAACIFCTQSLYSLEPKPTGFEVGTGASVALGCGKHQENCYRDINVLAAYTWNFAHDFGLRPEVGMYVNADGYTEKVPLDGIPSSVAINWEERHLPGIGFKTGLTVVRNLGPIDLFTGPYMRYTMTTTDAHRAGMLWSVGLGYSFWKLHARASYDFKLTKQFYETKDAVSIGVYYRF